MSAVITAIACAVLLNVAAAAFIVLRATVYGVRLYRPMLVNICLSFVPVLLALAGAIGLVALTPALAGIGSAGLSPAPFLWAYLALATVVWLLFFPNSVYLITELNLNHREQETPVPLWYDIVQTLTLTVSGIANAGLSLAIVQFGLIVLVFDPATLTAPASSWVFAGVVIVLGAVGVYLGRYLRLNSWDVRHPGGMIRKLRDHFRQRGRALEAVGFVVSHALLVALIYVPLFSLTIAALGSAVR